MDDTLPKSADRPKLVPARMFLRSNHKVRFNDYPSTERRMLDLGDDFSAEMQACRDVSSLELALGMLEVIGTSRDPRGPMACLYVIEAEGTGYCKIGVSVRPVERLGQLQTANAHKLSLFACVFSSFMRATEIESGVLKCATEQGWRAQGEWLRGRPEDVLSEIFSFAKRECYAICDPLTWFEDMRALTLKKASRMRRYRDRI